MENDNLNYSQTMLMTSMAVRQSRFNRERRGEQQFIIRKLIRTDTLDNRTCNSSNNRTHLNQDSGLVVGIGGEGLALFGRDGSIPLDEGGHDAAGGLDTHGKRSHVEQKQVLHLLGFVAAQDGGLNGGAVSDGLVGVDRLVQFFTVEEILAKGGSDEGLKVITLSERCSYKIG